MVVNLKQLIKEIEAESENFHKSLFSPYSDCSGRTGDVYGIETNLEVSTVENLESLAYELQDEMRQFENDMSLKYWASDVSSLCQKIIEFTVVDGKIYRIAKFDFAKEQLNIDDVPIFDNEYLDSYLEDITRKSNDKLDSLMINARDDVYALEAKINQLLALITGNGMEKAI